MAENSIENNIERLIKAHIAIKAKIDQIEEKHKKEKANLKSAQDKISAAIKKYLVGKKIASVKTDAGTAYKKTNQFVGVEDWDCFLGFITKSLLQSAGISTEDPEKLDYLVGEVVKKADWQFFNKSVNKTAVLEFFDQSEGDLPDGIKLTKEEVIGIRKQ